MVDDNVGTQLYTNDIIHFYAWSDDDFEAANLLEKKLALFIVNDDNFSSLVL